MAGELFQQFQVGKTKPADLDAAEDLVGAGLEDRLGFVDGELVGPDQLDGALLFRNRGCTHSERRILPPIARLVTPFDGRGAGGEVRQRGTVFQAATGAGTGAGGRRSASH